MLFTGSETAADMTLSLVFFQEACLRDFGGKPWVRFSSSLSVMSLWTVDFEHAKTGRQHLPYRGAGFSDIASEFQHSLFYVILHNMTVHHLIMY